MDPRRLFLEIESVGLAGMQPTRARTRTGAPRWPMPFWGLASHDASLGKLSTIPLRRLPSQLCTGQLQEKNIYLLPTGRNRQHACQYLPHTSLHVRF